MRLAKLHLTHPITSVEEYIDIDNDANIVHENNDDDWEQKLLEDLSASSTWQRDSPSDSNNDDTDETLDPCTTISYSKAAQHAKELLLYCGQNDISEQHLYC